jgi:MOSC domain-containing protein YiiM
MERKPGTVEAIYLAAVHGEAPHSVEAAVGHAGKGLEGDRNFGDADPDSCNITLIEAERLESQAAEHGLDLDPGLARRQVLVRGVDLGDFVGRRFQVGELECEGEERCEPCNHLAKLVGTQVVLKGLLHSGLRARILRSGTIRIGDEVQLSAEHSTLGSDGLSDSTSLR